MLMIEKADAASEAARRSPAQKAALTRLRTEMTKAGVLTSTEQLQPSANAKRLVYTANQRRTFDGPFAESKEMIGGFSIMNLGSVDEVLAMCDRYAKILGGTLEIDVRVVEPDAS